MLILTGLVLVSRFTYFCLVLRFACLSTLCDIPRCVTCGILCPWACASAVEGQSPNHWTAREVPWVLPFSSCIFYFWAKFAMSQGFWHVSYLITSKIIYIFFYIIESCLLKTCFSVQESTMEIFLNPWTLTCIIFSATTQYSVVRAFVFKWQNTTMNWL